MAETGPTSYDGFLSYSHAADDLLAPRLQAGLQRFAKPWWKRRALHIFRDEASLSANPHLWSSITDALDDSKWFVLLLSPDAAESEWVNREIDYWKEHRDPQKILPVVTDGTFGWSDGDVAGDAVPESLLGVFADEPRWVDLRFARTETQLDLRHTRFRDAVADIAAAVRGVAKDELESEEIHQHRRTVRTAWTAGVVILALGVAATVGAVVAYNAQQDAESNAALAQEERDRAVAAEQSATEERDRAISAEEEAERQRNVAEQERERAEANAAAEALAAREARARELAAAALLNLDFDPERSILLAIEAVETADSADRPDLQEPIIALRQAVAASRVVSRIDSGWFVAYSPDGSLIAGSDGGEGVDTAIWDAETGEQLHVLAAPEGRWMYNPTFSPDGRHLVVPYEPDDSETDQAGPVAIVWDVVTGEPVATFGGPDAGVSGNYATFSPDGTMLAVNIDGSLVVWDLASGTERYRIAHAEAYAPSHSFSPDGTLLALPMISDDPLLPSRVVLYDALTGMEIDTFDVGELRPPTTAFDPSGRRLAALSDWPGGLMVWDVASGETVLSLLTLEGQQSALAWSPDGDVIAVAGTEGVPRLLDAATGDEVLFLLGHDTGIYSLAFSPDGERLAAAAEYTDTLVWDITATGSREVATLATPYSYLGKMRYDADGNNLLVVTAAPNYIGSLFQLDTTTGEVMAEIPDQLTGYPLQVRLVPEAGLVATLNVDGTAALHDSQTFEPVATLPEGYFALDVSRDGTRVVMRRLDMPDPPEAIVTEVGSWETLATIGEGYPYYARFSPDGNLVTGYTSLGVFDIETQSYLATPDAFDPLDVGRSWIAASWSPDGSFLAVRTRNGRLGLVDVAALRDGATFAKALVFDRDAHDGLIQDPVHFNRDGSLIATWGNIDRHFKVWSTEDGQLVADLGERNWSGFDFHPNGRHLVTGGPDGTLRILTLDTDELLDIARSRITRGFTDDECDTYHLDPCPDLETIRGG